MERYILNVHFTEDEKVIWKKWSKHHDKMLMLSFLPVLIALISFNCVFMIYLLRRFRDTTLSVLYPTDQMTHDYEHTFAYTATILIGVIINIAIVTIIELFFLLISRIIMKKPDIMKQIIISVNLEKQTIDVQLLRVDSKKILLEKSYTAREFIDYVCSSKTNEIILDNIPYLIGTDKKKDVFTKEELKKYGIVHMPIKNLTTIESVSKIVELMKGVEQCFDQMNRIYIDSYR
jgi:hypothetical protein